MNRDIAIIGISGRFPEAVSIDAFYENLKSGRDNVRPISAARKASTTIPADRDYQVLGYLDDIDLFDHEVFKISFAEARFMDPRQRLLLEVVYEAIGNAGYNADHFNGSNTAIMVADTTLNYFMHADDFDPTMITGNLNAAMAGRIARFFNLRGAAEMIDTTCSSSLVALDHACNKLVLGDADHALVCGANLILFPNEKNRPIDIGIEAPDGKAKAFSASADGTGGGEAVVCLLLKPLPKALADRDIIHAVIKSVAVNQDGGLSASLTAPDSTAQAEVIQKAWEKAGIHPETVTFIEAHGTGTKLGDPIEADGLAIAFRKFTEKKHFCAMSSVKTNIGHTDSVAGLAGLAKVVLSLKHRVLFPSLHFDAPNPFIDFAHSAVYVNTSYKPWPAGPAGVRRAGVSSFGLIGTNAHAVLEEAPAICDDQEKNDDDRICLLTLSARDEPSLKSNMNALHAHLLKHPRLPVRDITYTLNWGRKHYACRYAITASTVAEALECLDRDAGRKFNNAPLPVKVIFCFSANSAVNKEFIDSYAKRDPLFNIYYSECETSRGKRIENDAYLQFVFHYAFYQTLVSRGLRSNSLIGDGIGKQVIAVLKGTTSLPEGIDGALAHDQFHADISNRLQQLIDNESHEKYVVFAEMGLPGNISQGLLQRWMPESNYSVVTASAISPDPMLDFLRDTYLQGCTIDWSVFYRDTTARRVELPVYAFKGKRCWIAEPPVPHPGNWFYEMKWIPAPLPSHSPPALSKTFLVFGGNRAITDGVCHALRASANRCVRTLFAEHYRQVSDDEFEVNTVNESDYVALARVLATRNEPVDGIIFVAQPAPDVGYEGLDHVLAANVYAQHEIVRAFRGLLQKKHFTYIAVTWDACQVQVESPSISPVNAMAMAFAKGLLSDHPALMVRSIDMASGEAPAVVAAARILSECQADDTLHFTAYRNNCRYVPTLVKCDCPDERPDIETGVYLVTGGARGIGLEVAKSLARPGTHLILLGRTSPDDHSIRESVTTLEELGATVSYYMAAVDDRLALQNVFEKISNGHKKIKGIIHAAGLGISNVSYMEKTREAFEEILRPKVHGTLLLEQMSRPLCPDYFVCFSSLNALVPQRNSIDYTVANAFEDAFAAYMASRSHNWQSINWPGWCETGMAFRAGARFQPEDGRLKPLKTKDGIEAFHRALTLQISGVAVADVELGDFSVNPFFRVGLPQTISAKATPVPQSEKVASVLTIDEQVMAIWREVLRSDTIQPDDDFFDIGGHSLNGTQVINRIEKTFGIEMEFEKMFDYPTVRTLSEYIAGLHGEVKAKAYQEIHPVAAQSSYPVSFAQRRLWVADHFSNERMAYNMPGAYLLEGTLNIDVLHRAYKALICRHESLRTVFFSENGEPRQRILDYVAAVFPIHYDDLREDPRREALAKTIAHEEASALFDLEKGPLIRARLIRLEDEKFLFLYTLHHIVSDGWSMEVFVRDMLILYDAFGKGEENPLPPLRIQYKDYVSWLNTQLNEENIRTHREYWHEQFRGNIPSLDFPTDKERPMVRTIHGNIIRMDIPAELTATLRRFSQRHDVTLFITLLTSVKALLYRYTGQEDIVIGYPAAGREHANLEDQIGFYLNTIPLRTRVAGHISFCDLLGKVRANFLNALQHQIYPFDELVHELNLQRDMSRSPLYDIAIVYQTTQLRWKEERPLEKVSVCDYDAGFRNSLLDLRIVFTEFGENLAVHVEYSTDLFVESTLRTLLNRMMKVFEVIGADPEISIDSLALYTPSPSAQVVHAPTFDFKFNYQ